ncbi:MULTISPECIES: beta-lactamase regulator AmpE [Plesiomonas]|jgi:AmpE protein|uniref:Regulatory protein AmpE n=1 Tax=Plesiomonas shigelloides 302-73 TaxID=1315976 RepID=R8AT57_PLESH|nr:MULTISPECIES: beta-lactamase regulator AmpE [Plesiomonas]MDO4688837.1 beta-lactamase regulator AmpE [Plesiomonas sp.]EON89506.1 regulatory protein AmpE [Plesiomonas shigelloides 302-73]KAB7663507.1 beta-lactamase regulator AmpE [Plesiomonas shigelloides]KAB7664024.1 beta-lactamase regulator AmpE [Plesiomonas shigelloides]KAB7676087.1 beta-lactamase regulator AmpE [Plesiomonas shigelloides]
MKLFSLLLILAWERLFKTGERWQLDHWLQGLWPKIRRPSLVTSFALWLGVVVVTLLYLWLIRGHLFGLLTLLSWIALGLLCIGAGYKRRRYHAFLTAARRGDNEAASLAAEQLARIHGLPGQDEKSLLIGVQSALLWTNFRYYMAPAFWFVVGGPAIMLGYTALRAYQSWLAEHEDPLLRAQSGVDHLLGWLDWIPVRLCSLAYVFAGSGEKALPAWMVSVMDWHTPAHRVLAEIGRFALSPQDCDSWELMAQNAVALARKAALWLVIALAVLTIYGLLL